MIEPTVGEAVAVVCGGREGLVAVSEGEVSGVGGLVGKDVHFAFLTRAMRLALASVEMLRWTPLLPRRPDRVMMRGVGTTSWFRLPCSTWDVVSTFVGGKG